MLEILLSSSFVSIISSICSKFCHVLSFKDITPIGAVIFISFRKPDRDRESVISIWFLILMELRFFSGNHSNLVSLPKIVSCLERNLFGNENAKAN
jgi:hypothetical protein